MSASPQTGKRGSVKLANTMPDCIEHPNTPTNHIVRPLRSRRKAELNKGVVKHFGTIKAEAILVAANLAGGYNSSSAHSHDLTDCILAKLNLLSSRCRIRHNPYQHCNIRRNS